MEGTTQSYANKYFNIKPVDAVISVYDASALGNYSTSQYEAGYEKQSMLVMWILSTFIVSVIFMNMLIAIMTDTFNRILAHEVSNSLSE